MDTQSYAIGIYFVPVVPNLYKNIVNIKVASSERALVVHVHWGMLP